MATVAGTAKGGRFMRSLIILCCALLLACFVVFIYALCVVSSRDDRQRELMEEHRRGDKDETP